MPRETRSARPGSAGARRRGAERPCRKKGVFRKEGEYWTVGYGGKSFRLKDSKGLGYLAHLLRHPATEFHVLDLAGGIAGQRDDDETGQSRRACLAGMRISKRRGSILAVWVMRARCSTSKPRSPTGAGFPICAKNLKKPKSGKRRAC